MPILVLDVSRRCQKSTLVYLNLSFQLTVLSRVLGARHNTLYTVGEGKKEVKERR